MLFKFHRRDQQQEINRGGLEEVGEGGGKWGGGGRGRTFVGDSARSRCWLIRAECEAAAATEASVRGGAERGLPLPPCCAPDPLSDAGCVLLLLAETGRMPPPTAEQLPSLVRIRPPDMSPVLYEISPRAARCAAKASCFARSPCDAATPPPAAPADRGRPPAPALAPALPLPKLSCRSAAAPTPARAAANAAADAGLPCLPRPLSPERSGDASDGRSQPVALGIRARSVARSAPA